MIEVPVGIDHDRHRCRGQFAEVGQNLPALRVGRARVDDEGLAVTEHDPDVLVVERVAAHEESVADLLPAIIGTHDRAC